MGYPVASLSGTLSLVLSGSHCKSNITSLRCVTPQVGCPSTTDDMEVGSILLLELNCVFNFSHFGDIALTS